MKIFEFFFINTFDKPRNYEISLLNIQFSYTVSSKKVNTKVQVTIL